MKFSDMLNKKKNKSHGESDLEPNLVEGTEQLNEVEQNQSNADVADKTDLPDGSEISVEDKLKSQLAEANDKYLRLYAEFDNYKRRTLKERSEQLQTAGKDVIIELLTVLDDFERAIKAMETATAVEPVKEGVQLVQTKLQNILTQKGLKKMVSIGQPFDADIHEAITTVPSDDMKGKVIDEVEQGYFLNDKVIRFSKVVVGG